MIGFVTDDQALYAASHHLSVVADDLDTDVAAIRARVDELLSGSWAGAAAQAFEHGWREWERGFAESRAALRSMARLLGSTAMTYADAEHASGTPFRQALDGLS